MATATEIRQKLFQAGIGLDVADQVARILADMPAFTAPAGGIWDTLNAKNFTITSRPTNTVFRVLSNGKKTVLVMTKDGLNSLFAETSIDTL